MTDTTHETPFRDIPAQQRPLMLIASGVATATATREAEDLEHAVRQLLASGIETGMDGSLSFLCEFALEVASALRQACRNSLIDG